MKKIGFVLIATLLLMSCTQQKKIGFVNSEEIITKYKETIKLEEQMKALDLKNQQELPGLINTFRAKVLDYQKRSKKMSDIQRKETEMALGREEQILKQRQNQVQTEGRVAMTKIAEKTNAFVKEYGKKNGYNMILGTVNLNGAVMYGDDASDITETILTALNAKFDKDNGTTTTPVKTEETKTDETKKEASKTEDAKK